MQHAALQRLLTPTLWYQLSASKQTLETGIFLFSGSWVFLVEDGARDRPTAVKIQNGIKLEHWREKGLWQSWKKGLRGRSKAQGRAGGQG